VTASAPPPRRVLYIDDDAGISRLVEKNLTRSGFAVDLAANGPDGVAKTSIGDYAAIALDHHMPGQDGLATLAALKTLPSCPPVVYVTGSDDLRIAVAALKAGAADYVIKEVAGEFLSLLHRAIDQAIDQAALQRDVVAAQDELRRLNETLELRVIERTIELEAANRKLREEMEERSRVEAQLLQAQKMEAVGQLTGGTAHDFNNLLTSVLGNLELVLPKIADEEARKLIANAVRSAERGATLTAQLLAFARKQDLRVRALDLNRLVNEADDLLVRALDPTIRLTQVLAPNLLPAIADPTQLELVLLNLAINARDAMPLGGTLRVETRNAPAGEAGRPADLGEIGDCVALAVSDNGSGMSEEIKARVFEPFFTTKEVGKGSGLGLSMVYGVAKQLGGTVTIDSTVGHGTCITVYLPCAAAASAEQPTVPVRPGAASRAPTAGARILLVDDDLDVREVAAATLKSLGYAVVQADGGRAALTLIDTGEAFDLLMTDLAMPHMRGADLAVEVRHRRPDLPVLVITGYGDPGTLHGYDAVLRKPFKGAELAAKIEECLGGREIRSNVLPMRRPRG
jgi:signal transduction histidine kinase